MPHYYFHFVGAGADPDPDDEGCERPDLAAAVEMAVAGARDIMAAEVQAGRLDLDQAIEIRDEDGTILAVLEFANAFEIQLPRYHPPDEEKLIVRERTMPSNDLA